MPISMMISPTSMTDIFYRHIANALIACKSCMHNTELTAAAIVRSNSQTAC